MGHHYEKLDENGDIKYLPVNDDKGEVTGRFIIGLKEYFDENPEERIRLGWTKHIEHDPKELVGYDPQTMYVVRSVRQIDEHTVEDVYHTVEKSEEMLLFEEMLNLAMNTNAGSGFVFF